MKKMIIIMCTAFIVSAQGEHPSKTKKAEHPTTTITPQIVQGEKITLQNLARAIEGFVEADIILRGAFLVIDPKTDTVLKLRLEKFIKNDYLILVKTSILPVLILMQKTARFMI